MHERSSKGTHSQAMKGAPYYDIDNKVRNESLEVIIVNSFTYDL